MIKGYINRILPVFLLFTAVMLIFPLVQYLYEAPPEPVWYALVIFAFFVFLWVLTDIILYIRKYRKLERLRKYISVYKIEFPGKAAGTEQIYREMVEEISRNARNLIEHLESRRSEQMEYYTMWVHQIKTPIAAFHLLLQEKKADFLLMEKELVEIEQYVEMALQYMRLENMSGDLVLRKCGLSKIIKQAINKYSAIFIHKKIALNLDLPDRDVLTDEKWLAFLIEQLLSNALKYTRKGSIDIYWDEPEAALVIEDTGVGIKKEDIKRIFEKGFTGQNGRIYKKASGLGLYLSRSIAAKLGHRLAIFSEEGKGTKAEIIFEQNHIKILE